MILLNYIMLSLFAFAVITQIFYYLFFYLQLKNKKKDTFNNQLPLSVIICAKDEANNLSKNLPKILEQNYNNFEVIVVNDASVDETQEVLERFKQKYDNLRFTTIPLSNRIISRKKFAQTLGIKSAKNEYLVFTDADCKPVSEFWLQKINNNFLLDKDIVLLYGKYEKTKGFLNKIIRFDAFFIAQQYLSFSLRNINYMGVGRNLAYKKSLFNKNKGFSSHMGLVSGDDDLFVNETSNKNNTIIEISNQSFTESEPEKTFREWINQKSRHFSTAKKYRPQHKFFLALEPLSRILLFIIIWLVINKLYVVYAFIAIGLVLIVKFFVFKKNTSLLQEKDLLLYSLLIDLILPIISVIIYLNLKFNKHLKWR